MVLLRVTLFIILMLLFSAYAGQTLRTVTSSKWVWWVYLLLCALVLINFFTQFLDIYNIQKESARTNAFGYLIILLVFQAIVVVFLSIRIFFVVLERLSLFLFLKWDLFGWVEENLSAR